MPCCLALVLTNGCLNLNEGGEEEAGGQGAGGGRRDEEEAHVVSAHVEETEVPVAHVHGADASGVGADQRGEEEVPHPGEDPRPLPQPCQVRGEILSVPATSR